MKYPLGITAAILASVCAIVSSHAQDVNQAAYDAAVQTTTQQQLQAALQTQQYNEQINQIATDNANRASSSPNRAKGFDLDALLFGTMKQPDATVESSEALPPAHRYHHHRKHVAQRVQ